MKKIVNNEKYGQIVYEENFWSGKREITLGDVKLSQKSKNIFIGNINGENIDFEVQGNFVSGARIKLDGEFFEIVPKSKWYEYVLFFLPLILVIIWGSSKELCQILPVVGGAIGGGISGGFSMAALIASKKYTKLAPKILCALIGLVAAFVTCAVIGLAIVG